MSVHFVGIGGIGMSAAARILLSRGERVTGTDLRESDVVAMLRERGATITVGRRARRVPRETSRIVYTAAAPAAHPEILDARERGIPAVRYAELLGELMEDRTGIAVAGVHGKTTTTAMVALILREAGLDPGAVVGGLVPEFAGNALEGLGRPFVAEACEYTRSFLCLRPHAAVITNVEAEHLDYYRDQGDVESAFREFAGRIRSEGTLVTTETVRGILEGAMDPSVTVITVGGRSADASCERLPAGSGGALNRFKVTLRGGAPQIFDLRVPGAHNALNAAMAAVLVRRVFDVPLYVSARSLGAFRGVRRRFECILDGPRVRVFDDYGHHPTEIAATLAAAREACPGSRLLLVFQPHQRSRTRHLLDGFVEALAGADIVFLPPTYRVAGREVEEGPDSDVLADRLARAGRAASWHPDFAALADAVEAACRPGDMILTMGAGDVHEVALELARRLR